MPLPVIPLHISSPDSPAIHYYRLRQVDIDGRASYSAVRTVKMLPAGGQVVQTMPNPVRDVLQVAIQVNEPHVVIGDISGRTILTLKLTRGIHQVNTSQWVAGMYRLSVYEDGQLVETRQLLKY